MNVVGQKSWIRNLIHDFEQKNISIVAEPDPNFDYLAYLSKKNFSKKEIILDQ